LPGELRLPDNMTAQRFLDVMASACDLARGVWSAIQQEHFHPNPTYRWCGPRYCEYWPDCRAAGR